MTKTIYITRNNLFKDLNLLLCNKITEADETFIDNNMELFYSDCETCNGSGEKDNKPCDDCSGEGRNDLEVYQYFLCSAGDYEKEYLESYGVKLGYSDLLDLYVLPIYDYGTSWSMFSYSKEVDDDYTLAYNETLTRTTHY
jgi:hypothetical protein